jgi:hypothetical protein
LACMAGLQVDVESVLGVLQCSVGGVCDILGTGEGSVRHVKRSTGQLTSSRLQGPWRSRGTLPNQSDSQSAVDQTCHPTTSPAVLELQCAGPRTLPRASFVRSDPLHLP